MRQIGISAVGAAVYTCLTTSAYMTGYTTIVYNFVPEGTDMPYIRFGDFMDRRSAMFGSRDFAPEDIAFMVHVFSNYQGDKECGDIMSAVTKALTATALSITGYSTLYNCELDYSDVMVDDSEPAQPCRHGILRFLIRVCP